MYPIPASQRTVALFVLTVLSISSLHSQKRYLISPRQEVIPLSPTESAATMIDKREHRSDFQSGICGDKFTFGYHPSDYPVNSNFGAFHKDVLGEWFVAKASGTIDTIFWRNRAAIGAYDSTIFLRVHRSVIGPDYGPGVRPGPFNPPCQNWGYWTNTNDLDQGIAAFVEEGTPANDSSWVSTINGSSVPSLPPFSKELWGLGGYAVKIHPNTVSFVAMTELSESIHVDIGDKFFLSMRVNHPPTNGGHVDSMETRTEWDASGFRATTADEDYPSRNWKFYEHDKGPSSCAGFPIDSIRKGWVARGGFGLDTLEVAAFNFWYVMTVRSNVPPVIVEDGFLHTTFDEQPSSVAASITDCNPENPAQAGVASAFITYEVNGVNQPAIFMTDLGSDIWYGTIPAQRSGAEVCYSIHAVDLNGDSSSTKSVCYRIISFGNEWYTIDTAGPCLFQDIRFTGTTVDTSQYFLPPTAPAHAARRDDGTAGPFDMGGAFVVFGDTFRYAWIGIDGAIALSKSQTDTQDVSANGQHGGGWDIPDEHSEMSEMFIAPFYSDFAISADSPITQYGRIVYGDNGNPCQFVIEWDSIGTFISFPGPPDEVTFRVILNRCDGTIEFQYNSVGTSGYDSLALVGMQMRSSSATWLFVNNDAQPYKTKPRNNWCIRLRPVVSEAVNDPTDLPTQFDLLPNFPNPFNPSTTVRYALPRQSKVTLKVFDVLGKEVATLVDEVQEPGYKEMKWEASNLPSGVYYYRLRAGEFIATKQMMLIR